MNKYNYIVLFRDKDGKIVDHDEYVYKRVVTVVKYLTQYWEDNSYYTASERGAVSATIHPLTSVVGEWNDIEKCYTFSPLPEAVASVALKDIYAEMLISARDKIADEITEDERILLSETLDDDKRKWFTGSIVNAKQRMENICAKWRERYGNEMPVSA